MNKEQEIKEMSETLLKIIQQQKNKYDQVLTIDDEIIKTEDLSGIDKQMEVRNNLFVQLDNITRLANSMQKVLAKLLEAEDVSWISILQSENLADKDTIKEMLNSLRETIIKVTDLDNKVVSLLEAQKSEIQQKLKNIAQHKVLEHAYHDLEDSYPNPQIFDKMK